MTWREEQLSRLVEQATRALSMERAGMVWMPLADSMHPRCVKVGDFVIVDMKDHPLEQILAAADPAHQK